MAESSKPRSKKESGYKEYLIEKHDEKILFKVPASWKVTYGPIQPGNHDHSYRNGPPAYVLRFYEAENKQRAVFQNVVSFRDTSLEFTRFVQTKGGQLEFTQDAQGNRSNKEFVEVGYEQGDDLPF